jgi:hypothetical protein
MEKPSITLSVLRIRTFMLLCVAYFCLVSTGLAHDDTKPKNERTSKKLLPPPTPTVVLTLPSGSNCYSTLTASGCGTAQTYWYTGSSYYSNSNPLTVSTNTPIILKAVCYDGTFGDYSPEYKAISATLTDVTPSGTSTICSGGNITLNASSAFTGLSYQWYRNSSFLSGATGSSYSATTAGTYTVVASNSSCSSTSTGATVTVNTPTTPTISPSFTGSCGNQTVTMATQSGLVGTFQWKLNGSNISGANSASYATSTVGSYTVDFTSNGCTVTSSAYVFAQNSTPTITLNPPISPSCNATFNASGCSGTVSWERNLGGNWTFFTSGNPLNVPASTNPPEYRAKCLSNGCTSSPSNELKGTPNNFTEITPSSSTICAGSSVTLNASSASTGLSYQWLRNFSNISGANSASYVATLAGQYTLTVTNGSCSFTSGAATVTVSTPPSVSITSSISSPATIVNGQSLTLNANGCSGGTILWSNNATTASITVSPSSNTTYTFTCTQTPCVVTSSGFIINVNALLPPTLSSSSVSTCTGTSVTLTATTCAGGGTVTWSTSQTGQSITVSPSSTTNYTATCTVGSVTSAASSPLQISVFDGTITSVASGNWNTPATWSCNCIPAFCNDVTVEIGHTVTIPVSDKGKLKNLTVKGTVDMKSPSTMALKE